MFGNNKKNGGKQLWKSLKLKKNFYKLRQYNIIYFRE